ncbi:hypothetical protein ACC694_37475, partial [Rhizobium ruizarguesonis]
RFTIIFPGAGRAFGVKWGRFDGAAGLAYDREFVIENLLEFYKKPEPEGWSCSEFSIRQLAEGLYQLNYILQQPDRRTRRTTLWRKNEEAWQIVFHHGTVIT